ncbi:DUF4271 domain-containing protein [Polaribacter reichenbachii]|uniref:DUF4271 domain-containing protein n=1 Tax=Polaribacter reichenbachii TaxID=996801 RepID=A0A1B8TV06_9FLAO|nr:DUF4271 domain-containing protein [Polaribacter reichenbachii]APZ45635.1 DUF4271 domain-containing protein [Polaribacter reichenbachii]AUC19497.1 DUF4271 domain-containing protein [Polaribacter reichenbachii]OBY63349.1 hypothetical protein LPB301_11030 [Polaribacter reichenbachii]
MQAIENIVDTNNWITILLFLLLVSVVLLKLLNSKRLNHNFKAFFSLSLIDDEFDSINFLNPFQITIFLFSTSVLSLLAFTFKAYITPETGNSFAAFLTIFAYVLVYLLLKRTLEYALSLLFLIKRGVRFFMISKINSLNSISFLLYIALILYQYANIHETYVFYFAAILFIVRFTFSVIRNKKLIFNQLFYFILYICAFEIAPLFVLFKLMF